MGEFFKSTKFKVILFVIAAAAGFALFSASQAGHTIGSSQAISVILNPVKKFSNTVSGKVKNTLDAVSNSEKYKDENEQLRKQIADLNKRLVQYEDIKSELSDLKKFIGIKEEHPYFKFSSPCTIISRTANDPYGTFVIDKGSNNGISLYDPVVTDEGLVGIIIETADTYSTVRTILSPDLSVGALCVESRDTGIVEGNINYAESGKCKMIYVDKSNKIRKGDLIITSGNSGQFPQGYIIGNVEETGIEESGLNAYAVIKPVVDVKEISSVIVITDFGEEGEKGEED